MHSMIQPLQSSPVLVAQSRIDALSNAFQNKEPADYTIAMIIFGSVLTTAVLGYLGLVIYRWQASKIVNCPKKMFKELCRAHTLSSGEKASLVKLATARKLKDPCRVFIDSQLWMLDPTRDRELCKPKHRSILRRTRTKLFPNAEDFFDSADAKSSK